MSDYSPPGDGNDSDDVLFAIDAGNHIVLFFMVVMSMNVDYLHWNV